MWLLYNVAFLQQHGFHFNDVALLPCHKTCSTTTLPYCKHGLLCLYKVELTGQPVAPDLTSSVPYGTKNPSTCSPPLPSHKYFSKRTCCLSRIFMSHQKLESPSSELSLDNNTEDQHNNRRHYPKLGEHPYHDVTASSYMHKRVAVPSAWAGA